MMKIETNPVKLAYYDHLMMEDCAKRYIECSKSIAKRTAKFTDIQMAQYLHLIDGTLKLSQVKDDVK